MSPTVIDDPIGDARWMDLVARHPSATVFHTPEWLRALRNVYGYQPFAVTSSAGLTLRDGLVGCRVPGWRGSRIVALPFADHCDPLIDGPESLAALLGALVDRAQQTSSALELRPCESIAAVASWNGLQAGRPFWLHRVDLRGDLEAVFRRMHPSNTQRAIRRAEREELGYARGSSPALLADFYPLYRMTRRRHGLPPAPMAWFRELLTAFGERMAIHVASKGNVPIASVVTLSFKGTTVYKYGGSDAAHHRRGGMPFLFWRVMSHAKAEGAAELDLGRTDVDQPGLIAFKDHLGGTRSALTYFQTPGRRAAFLRAGLLRRAAGNVFRRLPDPALDLAGRLLYRRLG